MIVDCHTHLHCPQRGPLQAEHAAAMENVDACFVLASGSADHAAVNRELAGYTDEKAMLTVLPLSIPLKNPSIKKQLRR